MPRSKLQREYRVAEVVPVVGKKRFLANPALGTGNVPVYNERRSSQATHEPRNKQRRDARWVLHEYPRRPRDAPAEYPEQLENLTDDFKGSKEKERQPRGLPFRWPHANLRNIAARLHWRARLLARVADKGDMHAL